MFEAEWSPRMEEAGYASIYFGRVTDDQMGEPEEGCILLYRLDKFICLQEVSRCFASIIPEVEGGQFWDKVTGGGAICFPPLWNQLNQLS